jgi:hypothetical protein
LGFARMNLFANISLYWECCLFCFSFSGVIASCGLSIGYGTFSFCFCFLTTAGVQLQVTNSL